MDTDALGKIKKTLLVILRARNCPAEIALLALVDQRWETEEVENNDSYDYRRFWELKLFLPAETYAISTPNALSQASDLIMSTLNEVVRANSDKFVRVDFFPELVNELSFTQAQLIDWLAEAKEQGRSVLN